MADFAEERQVEIKAGKSCLQGMLGIPEEAVGVVLFAHGSGSSRFSPRNTYVASMMRRAGLATLLMDLLTEEEEIVDMQTMELRFNISLLAERLGDACSWLAKEPDTAGMQTGCFGASTGGGAALMTAAEHPDMIDAVVSRGGRPDLAREALPKVTAPTLLIVGGEDTVVLELNREALRKIPAIKELAVIPGATHLFEEAGALEKVAQLAISWFLRYLES